MNRPVEANGVRNTRIAMHQSKVDNSFAFVLESAQTLSLSSLALLFFPSGIWRFHLIELSYDERQDPHFYLWMLDAGYLVRLGNSDRIDHFESPKRDTRRTDLYGRRNDVLFVWLNVPWPWLRLHLAAVTVNGILFGIRVGRPFRMLNGLWMGFRDAWRYRSHRKPVRNRTYRVYRRLRKAGKLPLSEIEAELKPVQSSLPNDRIPHSRVGL
jgi:hypothetical protein